VLKQALEEADAADLSRRCCGLSWLPWGGWSTTRRAGRSAAGCSPSSAASSPARGWLRPAGPAAPGTARRGGSWNPGLSPTRWKRKAPGGCSFPV